MKNLSASAMVLLLRMSATFLSSVDAFIAIGSHKNDNNKNHEIGLMYHSRGSNTHLCTTRASKYDRHDHYDDCFGQNVLDDRTCIQYFLNQRAIQSFQRLQVSCRDPHTVKWLERKLESNNLLNYHGTGAFNSTKLGSWDTLLINLMNERKETVVVKTKSGSPFAGNRGANAAKNPYIEDRFVEFRIDIDPPSLVSRILSVREQIALEWSSDLDTLVHANDIILSSYSRNQEIERHNENRKEDSTNENNNGGAEKLVNEGDEDITDSLSSTSEVDESTSPHLTSSPSFDRGIAMTWFQNSIAFKERKSSVLRQDSFDLLLLLSTQESVHRVLREYRKNGRMSSECDYYEGMFDWLKIFYVDRLNTHFDGHHQDYGSADDFLEELLLTPPSIIDKRLIDPFRIAEDIIRMRSIVANDWKDIVHDTPKDHMIVRRALLAKQMVADTNIDTLAPFVTAERTPSDVVKFETAEDFQ